MGKYTILIVDDSPTQVAFLEDALLRCGYHVETSLNGQEAIAKIHKSPPDVVLSDVLMPELNGYHLCRLLKNEPATADIPVILLTNLSEQHDRFWGENAGADLFLEKETSVDGICSEVAKVIRHSPRRPSFANVPRRKKTVSEIDARTKVTSILDRLLYDSTISNEILKLTSHVNDLKLLAEEYFRFLGAISRYTVSGLLIDLGHERMVVCLQVPATFSSADIKIIKHKGLASLDFPLPPENHIETIVVESEATEAKVSDMETLYSRSVFAENRNLGGIFLLDRDNHFLTEGTLHSLNVVAERMEIVIRYLLKVREIEAFKADFISMMVHDLRSPLTSIKGYADLLGHGVLGDVSDEQAVALDNIQGGCIKLLELIEDILDLSKLEAGKVDIYQQPTLLQDIFLDNAKVMKPLLNEKNLSLRVNVDEKLPLANIDRKQISRVFCNLVSNAIKFTGPGGNITVDIYPEKSRQVSDIVNRVDITDTGLGIPPEKQSLVFTRYQQFDSDRQGERVGTGLGLAICREIVQMHGGQIWMKSPVEGSTGTRFSLTLPTV
ncbi:MAG TPA: ATP-binding protein [Desulfuromonadales bacterium]|nr:ATP-binding protein [Desulfuromonadales bacterium]